MTGQLFTYMSTHKFLVIERTLLPLVLRDCSLDDAMYRFILFYFLIQIKLTPFSQPRIFRI